MSKWDTRLGAHCWLDVATRSLASAANTSPKTVRGTEGRRPRTTCEAFWTGWQKSPKDHEGPQPFSGLFARKEAAMPEQQQGSPDASKEELGDLALSYFVFFKAFCFHPAIKLPYLLVMGDLIRTRIWSSPTALLTRTAVTLMAPLSFVRYLQTLRALDLDAIVGPDKGQHTALMMACAVGYNQRIRDLLSLGARPDVAPAGMPRPLLIACCIGNTEAVEDLLRAGASPASLPGDDTSPLEAACCKGHAGVVRALLNAGVPVNGPSSPTATTPLSVAIGFSHAEVVEVLLQAGASPTAEYGMGMTPIGIACVFPNGPGLARAAIVHLLLQAGADPRVVHRPQPGESSRTGSVRAEQGSYLISFFRKTSLGGWAHLTMGREFGDGRCTSRCSTMRAAHCTHLHLQVN